MPTDIFDQVAPAQDQQQGGDIFDQVGAQPAQKEAAQPVQAQPAQPTATIGPAPTWGENLSSLIHHPLNALEAASQPVSRPQNATVPEMINADLRNVEAGAAGVIRHPLNTLGGIVKTAARVPMIPVDTATGKPNVLQQTYQQANENGPQTGAMALGQAAVMGAAAEGAAGGYAGLRASLASKLGKGTPSVPAPEAATAPPPVPEVSAPSPEQPGGPSGPGGGPAPAPPEPRPQAGSTGSPLAQQPAGPATQAAPPGKPTLTLEHEPSLLDQVVAHTEALQRARDLTAGRNPADIAALRDAVEETGKRAHDAGDIDTANRAAHADIALSQILEDAIKATNDKSAATPPPAQAANLNAAAAALTGKPISDVAAGKGDIFDQIAPPAPKPVTPDQVAAILGTNKKQGRPTVQGSDKPEQIQQSAQEQKPAMQQAATAAVAGIPGAKVEGVRVKDAESVANKDDRGKAPETITDHLGGRVSAPTPEAVAQVKQNIEQNLPVVGKDQIDNNGLKATQYAVQTGKPGEANQQSELQVVTTDQAKAMKDTDGLYDKQKEALARGDQKEADRLGAQIKEKFDAAQSLAAQGPAATQAAGARSSEALAKLPQAEQRAGAVRDVQAQKDQIRQNLEHMGPETARKYGEAHPEAKAFIDEVFPSKPAASKEGSDETQPRENKGTAAAGPEHGSGASGTGEGNHQVSGGGGERGLHEGVQPRSSEPAGAGANQPAAVEPEPTKGTRIRLKDGRKGTVEWYDRAKKFARIRRDDGKMMPIVPRDGFTLASNQGEKEEVTPEAKGDKWIGVDLDGTLAQYDGFKGKTVIGEPIPAMVARVKQWIKDGNNVRILTARVNEDKDGTTRNAIQDWTEKHIGQRLPVTDVKDQHLVALYDDRAVNVQRNTGKILSQESENQVYDKETYDKSNAGAATHGGSKSQNVGEDQGSIRVRKEKALGDWLEAIVRGDSSSRRHAAAEVARSSGGDKAHQQMGESPALLDDKNRVRMASGAQGSNGEPAREKASSEGTRPPHESQRTGQRPEQSGSSNGIATQQTAREPKPKTSSYLQGAEQTSGRQVDEAIRMLRGVRNEGDAARIAREMLDLLRAGAPTEQQIEELTSAVKEANESIDSSESRGSAKTKGEGGEVDAIREQSPKGLLQREPEEDRGGNRGRVQPEQQGNGPAGESAKPSAKEERPLGGENGEQGQKANAADEVKPKTFAEHVKAKKAKAATIPSVTPKEGTGGKSTQPKQETPAGVPSYEQLLAERNGSARNLIAPTSKSDEDFLRTNRIPVPNTNEEIRAAIDRIARDRYADVVKQYQALPDKITGYRAVSVTNGMEGLDRDNLGRYWSDKESGAQAYHERRGGTHTAILKATIDKGDLDVTHTFLARMRFATGNDESELNLKDGAKPADPQYKLEGESGYKPLSDTTPAPAKGAEHKYKFGNTQHNISPDSDAAKALDEVRASIPADDLAGQGKDIDGNHVTVRYGIQGEDAAGIKAFIEQQAPFDATLGPVAKFPPSEHSDGAAPLIAPVESPDLHKLNAEIEKHGDFIEPNFPEYKPHATVAYVKPEAADKYVGDTTTEGATFRVDSIDITDRDGNSETVQLKGTAPLFSPGQRVTISGEGFQDARGNGIADDEGTVKKFAPAADNHGFNTAVIVRPDGNETRISWAEGKDAPIRPFGEAKPKSEPKKPAGTPEEKAKVRGELAELVRKREEIAQKYHAAGGYYGEGGKELSNQNVELTKQILAKEDELARLNGEPTRDERKAMQEQAATAPFDQRPSQAMKYDQPQQSQHWQVMEPDYANRRFESQVAQYERAVKSDAAEVENAKAGTKAYDKAKASLDWRRSILKRLKDRDDKIAQQYKHEYLDLVKKAISKGSPVPDSVIAQYSEFRTALDARERYEKGRHTSFANRSAAINDTMQKEEGFKAKRQDGKAITDVQVKEIKDGIADIATVLGADLRDMMRGTDLTIAHTNGKHPFLSDAGGMYHPGEKSISAGINDWLGQPVRALAHEVGHWFDYESGKVMGAETKIMRGGKRVATAYASEADADKARYAGYAARAESLYSQALKTMTDTREVERMLKVTKISDLKPETRSEVERTKVVLGHYWREPREIFARLFEQYISEKLGRGGLASETPELYHTTPGWWDKDAWAKLEPMVEAEVNKRLAAMRERYAPKAPEATPEAASVPAARPKDWAATMKARVPVPAPGQVGEMRTADLSVDPNRFQYKLKTDAEGVGTLLKEQGAFNPELAGTISVWTDPANGKTYVINGHHRFELARRTKSPTVAVRHIIAKDAAEARSTGALQNISEGRGTPIDAAKFFRDTGFTSDDLAKSGVSMGEATASKGLALSRLDEKLFGQVVQGTIPVERAVVIGEATANHAEQRAIAELVERQESKGKKITNDTLRELARFVGSSGKSEQTTATLFGDETISQSHAIEKAEVSSYVKQQIAKDRKLFGFVAKGERADELERGNNIIDVDSSKAIAEEATQAEEVYDLLSNRTGPISDVLDDAAARIAGGENPNAVKREAYDDIRAEISQTLPGGQAARSRERKGRAAREASLGTPDDRAEYRKRESGPSLSGIEALTDEQLSSWGKSRSLKIEEAGEQGDLFGSAEVLYRVSRIGSDGQRESALVPASKIERLRETNSRVRQQVDQGSLFGPSDLNTFYTGFLDPALFKRLFPDVAARTALWAGDTVTPGDEQRAMMRETRGQMDRRVAIAIFKLRDAAKEWRTRPRAESIEFWNAVENGRIATLSPKDQALAQVFKAAFDQMKGDIQKLKPEALQNYIENYFPHIWDKSSQVTSTIKGVLTGKKPLAGKGGFLKRRTIPTMQDGLDMGFVPKSWNPVDLFVLKYAEMAQFLMGHQTLQVMKDSGTAKFVRLGQKAPDGWTQLDDKISTVHRRVKVLDDDKLDDVTQPLTWPGGKRKIPGAFSEDIEDATHGELALVGHYYAPADAAKIFNNFVSRGIAGRSSIYDTLRWLNDNLNGLQLGISAFHATVTTVNAAASDIALGIEQLMQGKPVKAGASMASGAAILPTLFRTIRNGSKLMREYLSPGSHAKMAKEAEALAEAGGRVTQNTIELSPLDKAINAFRNGAFLEGLSAVPGAILHSLTYPVLGYYVPKMKVGAFYYMAHNILDEAQRKNWKPELTRERLQEAWDSIDDRFGQVVYDNLFWHKGLRDALHLTVRAVGYTYGDIRTYGGAAIDTAKAAVQVTKGKKPRVTPRMAFAVGSFMSTALLGGVMTFLWTGHAPQTWKDYTHPRDTAGQRHIIPGYPDQMISAAHDPIQWSLNKQAPIWSAFGEMMRNQDYDRTEIRHKDDSPVQQIAEVAEWAAKQAVPFSFTNTAKLLEQRGALPSLGSMLHEAEKHPGDLALGQLGFQPAPAFIQNSAALNKAREYVRQNAPAGTKTREQAEKTRAMHAVEDMYRTGEVDQATIQELRQRHMISQADVLKARLHAKQEPLVRLAKSLSPDQALHVWNLADEKERKELRPTIELKSREIQTKIMDPAKRNDLHKQYREALNGKAVQIRPGSA